MHVYRIPCTVYIDLSIEDVWIRFFNRFLLVSLQAVGNRAVKGHAKMILSFLLIRTRTKNMVI